MDNQQQPSQVPPPGNNPPPNPIDNPQIPTQPVEDSANVTATQIGNPQTEEVTTPTNEKEVKKELGKVNIKSKITHYERLILHLVSYFLIAHGLLGLYSELVEIFYIFPVLPEFFEYLGYSNEAYQSLYRKTLFITITALVETIYGLAIIARMNHLAHRLHIFSAIMLLIISNFISSRTQSLEDLDVNHRLPETPSIQNLIQAESNEARIHLFKNLNAGLQATQSGHPNNSE